ncbi:type II toxin-antitoxin system RelE/ParE family toxin [Methanocalculus taiwanensis]|uniref:Type II toxin-antitoxin system RelE/ParE family toxin n=1 Tax=Methanocalculus taiwanensis TaxID=106207 RepID=A0ABD4TGU0_9EURY|nr:type II toxin-antitoxin system RelE/ParE family toxin [Methanocalculus taiwanensis]MCQ1538174.1 type II toxin-antitoxin system RelE/ParE family toxin [Methanocalculus taiwanensis]
MEYTIIWTDKSRKNLEKLPKDIAARIIERVEIIRDDPFLHIDRLAGSAWYTYRVGKYRIILDIKRKNLIIYVIKVGPRKAVYKNLE